MSGIHDLYQYILGAIAIILVPGPNSLYCLSVAGQYGARAAYRTIGGIVLGHFRRGRIDESLPAHFSYHQTGRRALSGLARAESAQGQLARLANAAQYPTGDAKGADTVFLPARADVKPDESEGDYFLSLFLYPVCAR